MEIIDFSKYLGKCDLLFITLDSLRYDAAMEAFNQGQTPELASILPESGWEKRYTPGNYTLPAHYAFFNGFLPTPVTRGYHEYSNVLYIPAPNEKSGNSINILNSNNIVTNLADHGYRTICIGGVGFFSNKNYLGRIFTQHFQESYWTNEMSISNKTSTENQVKVAKNRLKTLGEKERIFLFMNVSSTHKPSHIFLKGAKKDSVDSQKAAIAYSDIYLGLLIQEMRSRADVFAIICSDHGEAFGENGLYGHRNSHPVVMIIPYGQMLLKKL